MNAETSRSDLNDRILSVFVKIFVQTAFAGVVVDAEFFRRAGKGSVSVITYRTVTHRGEHHRHRKGKLKRFFRNDFTVCVAFDFLRAGTEENTGFHRFAQRVYRRIGYLRRVEKNFIEVDGKGFGIAHGREENAARFRLFVYLRNVTHLPVGVIAEFVFVFGDFKRARRAETYASLTVYAFSAVREHLSETFVVTVHVIGALPFAHSATYAFVVISYDLE